MRKLIKIILIALALSFLTGAVIALSGNIKIGAPLFGIPVIVSFLGGLCSDDYRQTFRHQGN